MAGVCCFRRPIRPDSIRFDLPAAACRLCGKKMCACVPTAFLARLQFLDRCVSGTTRTRTRPLLYVLLFFFDGLSSQSFCLTKVAKDGSDRIGVADILYQMQTTTCRTQPVPMGSNDYSTHGDPQGARKHPMVDPCTRRPAIIVSPQSFKHLIVEKVRRPRTLAQRQFDNLNFTRDFYFPIEK